MVFSLPLTVTPVSTRIVCDATAFALDDGNLASEAVVPLFEVSAIVLGAAEIASALDSARRTWFASTRTA